MRFFSIPHRVQALHKGVDVDRMVVLSALGSLLGHFRHHEQLFDANGLVVDGLGDAAGVLLAHVGRHPQHLADVLGFLQQRDGLGDPKGLDQSQIFQQVVVRGGPHHHEPPSLVGRDLLEEDQQRLQDGVGKTRPDRNVVDEPLDVVQKDNGQRALVGIHKGLVDHLALAHVRVSNHLVGGDHAHKGKPGIHRQLGSNGRLSRGGGSLQQDGHERGPLGRPDLFHQPLEDRHHNAKGGPVRDKAVAVVGPELLRLGPELGFDVVERLLEIGVLEHQVPGVRGLFEILHVQAPGQRKGTGRLDESLQLGTGKVLGLFG
mmetsp:Transcript_2017/g.5365  ORF Transcript_2017/g.5365 Transcript_2017/m.5365 type:complete len:317 (+) Transcript_2017:272-1222(+)